LNEDADDGVVELSRFGAEIRPPSNPALMGFAREFRSVKVRSMEDRMSPDIFYSRQLSEAWKFCLALYGSLGSVYRSLRQKVTGRGAQEANSARSTVIRVNRPLVLGGDAADVVYARFLAGEMDDDEDGPDYVDGGNAEADDSDGPSEGSQADGEETPSPTADAAEESTLFADLMMQPTTPGTASTSLAPVFVAHLTTSGALTRRRYNEMIGPSSLGADEAAWAAFVAERRSLSIPRADEELRLICVVCTVDPRSVVIWPCRCLALCDDCRANMAARFSTSKHVCPCCRQKVEGYSRVFVP